MEKKIKWGILPARAKIALICWIKEMMRFKHWITRNGSNKSIRCSLRGLLRNLPFLWSLCLLRFLPVNAGSLESPAYPQPWTSGMQNPDSAAPLSHAKDVYVWCFIHQPSTILIPAHQGSINCSLPLTHNSLASRLQILTRRLTKPDTSIMVSGLPTWPQFCSLEVPHHRPKEPAASPPGLELEKKMSAF